jgi:hypothetical protein
MRLTLAAASLTAMLGAGSTAQAFTLASRPALERTDIVRVAGGCGLGWHRGPYGGCRRNFYGYDYYGSYAYYRPYAYYPGYYGGRCWWTVTPYGSRRVCTW